MLGGAFSCLWARSPAQSMRSGLLFVKGLLETARSFEAVDPVVCEHHALDDALRHESLDHDERFKQQVVARDRRKLVPLLRFRALRTEAGHRPLPCNRDAQRWRAAPHDGVQLCDR